MFFLHQVKQVDVWPPSCYRLDYTQLFKRRAFLCYERRIVGRQLLFYISIVKGCRAHQQELIRKCQDIATADSAHAIFTVCNDKNTSLAEFLTQNGYEEAKDNLTHDNYPGSLYQRRLSEKPLDPDDSEPSALRQIRQTIVSEFLKYQSLSGIGVHPVFEDLSVTGNDVVANFNPAVLTSVYAGLKKYVRKGIKFIDLGSGDGRIPLLAAALGAKSTGIESHPGLFELARSSAKGLEQTNANFINEDFFTQDLSDYDSIFYAGATAEPHEKALEEKLLREMKKGAEFFVYREIHPFRELTKRDQKGEITVYCR